MEHLSYFQYGRGKLNEHLRRRNSFSRAVHGIEAGSSLRSVHGKRKGNNGAGAAAWFAFEPNLSMASKYDGPQDGQAQTGSAGASAA
jgi:hypothetical protein